VGRKPSLLRRLVASTGSLDAEERTADVVENRFVRPCSGLAEGDKVEVLGRIRSVAYTPRESVPTLEAELFDGTGTVSLVWLGRRRIAGIEPGRTLWRRPGGRARRPPCHVQPALRAARPQ
jgi:hypothetical protein